MEEFNESIGSFFQTASSSSSIHAGSTESSSSFSSEMADDASSSSTVSTSPPPPLGPLYELDELMAHLPIKRGLSKFYHGKSQTFGSLANVKSLEDLAKKRPITKRMKSCTSLGGNLNQHRFCPKPVITKKSPKRPPFPLLPTAAKLGAVTVVDCTN